MCEWHGDVWQKKKTTPKCRLFLFRGVLQVSLPEFVIGKCTRKRKGRHRSAAPSPIEGIHRSMDLCQSRRW
jgi:hypothetical protein